MNVDGAMTDLFACPKNVLGVDPSCMSFYSRFRRMCSSCVQLAWIFALIGFMFLQVFVILLQEQFGPGFFLPKSVRSMLLLSFMSF